MQVLAACVSREPALAALLTPLLAGEGQEGWGIDSIGEDGNVQSYFCDFVGGAVHDNHLNALLSDEAKDTIHSWSKAGCTGACRYCWHGALSYPLCSAADGACLSWHSTSGYGSSVSWPLSPSKTWRRKRCVRRGLPDAACKPAHSPCALQEEQTGQPLDSEVQWAMEGGPGAPASDQCCSLSRDCTASGLQPWLSHIPVTGLREDGSDNYFGVWECDRAMGVGERHVKMLPRAPHYEVRALLDTTGSGFCPPCCVLQYGTDLAVNPEKWEDRRREKPVQQLEWELAQSEEAQAVHEFRQNLDYNLGKVGWSVRAPCCRLSSG